jgi:hypothetical protein
MIYERFVTEYPARCLELLDLLEPKARQKELLASFGLLAAAAVFVIPYERLQARHPMYRPKDSSLAAEIKQLDRQGTFLTAPFWNGQPPGEWRMSRVMKYLDEPALWKDQDGNPPMSQKAENLIEGQRPGKVLRVVRNALAHGNIVYLNKEGMETRNTPVLYLGFISHYTETRGEQAADGTYRLVVTTEENFIHFVRSWAKWAAGFRSENKFFEAA